MTAAKGGWWERKMKKNWGFCQFSCSEKVVYAIKHYSIIENQSANVVRRFNLNEIRCLYHCDWLYRLTAGISGVVSQYSNIS